MTTTPMTTPLSPSLSPPTKVEADGTEETFSSPRSPNPLGSADFLGSPDLLDSARKRFSRFRVAVPDPQIERDLTHGWLLPALLHLDDCLWHRWDYWRQCQETEELPGGLRGELPQTQIPRLDILHFPHQETRQMLEASLDCIPQHGSWQTWGGWTYFDYFLSWLLFGFGHKGQSELPVEPSGCVGASNRLYQVFCLDAMLLWPYDYFGDILAQSSYGKRQGFYPTPHTICEFMTRMTMPETGDHRRESVCDPCVGTGRMLLHASNHSLRLYGLDIDETLCKATLVNGYLFMPWLVRPLPALDPELALLETRVPQGDAHEMELQKEHTMEVAASLSEAMIGHAEPNSRSTQFPTEHDAEGQRRVAPLLKRRRKPSFDPSQGSLFGAEEWGETS